MRTIIAGCRQFAPTVADQLVRLAVRRAIYNRGFPAITEVVSGRAHGIDRAGERWAVAQGIPVKKFPVEPADWERYGLQAGRLRNQQMAEYVGPGGALIAVWDGSSRGTRHMIECATAIGLRVYVDRT